MGLGCLRDHLSLIMSVHLTKPGTEGLLWGPFYYGVTLGGSQDVDLLYCGIHLMEHAPPESEATPSLLTLNKSLKPWLCCQAWGSHRNLLSHHHPLCFCVFI